VLDRQNQFTAIIREAADALLREVRDPVVRSQLARIRDELPRHGTIPARFPTIPSRHRAWGPLLELAWQILQGFDVTLTPPAGKDDARAPGFLVRTWQAWERLVFVALRREWGDQRVHSQEEHVWGWRGSKPVNVKPDTSIHAPTLIAPVDAKYKTRVDLGRQAIRQSDLMEASAFIDACGGDAAVLLYPRLAEEGGAPGDCGSCTEFDRVDIGPKVVLGVEVEVRGIGKPGGYAEFANRLALDLQGIHPALASGVLRQP
jgi:5-methylcytosine-specific restriction enzyme subunit McrC